MFKVFLLIGTAIYPILDKTSKTVPLRKHNRPSNILGGLF